MSLSLSFTMSNNSGNCNSTWHHLTHCHTTTLQFHTFKHSSLHHLNTLSILRKTLYSRIHCTAPQPLGYSVAHLERTTIDDLSQPDIGGGEGGGGYAGSGGGGGGDGGESGGNGRDEEYVAFLNFEAVMKEAEAHGLKLPTDMVEVAKITGIQEIFLRRYLDLQGVAWPLSFLMKHWPALRNRMLADPSFLFKVGIEVLIDSCCATYAEYKKRGKEFWPEIELVTADVLIGVVVDIVLVGLLAPYARIGKVFPSKGLLGRIQHACAVLPSSVFEAERPGCKFSVMQRITTYFYKGALYGSVGFGCGLIGQAIANMIMNAKRSVRKSEEHIPVPPLLQSAALWGFFLALSSNTRYQLINGLERLVETSPLSKKFPLVTMAFTIGVRYRNNIYGGMQFVDWAKQSGVQ